MNIGVVSCKGCPFQYQDWDDLEGSMRYVCNRTGSIIFLDYKNIIKSGNKKVLDNCPLLSDDIIVKIFQDE
jgi:hypothetical protein